MTVLDGNGVHVSRIIAVSHFTGRNDIKDLSVQTYNKMGAYADLLIILKIFKIFPVPFRIGSGITHPVDDDIVYALQRHGRTGIFIDV